jgi:hypothetical protein
VNPFEYRQSPRQLDFYAFDEGTGQLVRCKVRLGVITGFGVQHEPVFTAAGTFSCWHRYGYLQTEARTYRVSARLIRAWQRAWRWELVSKQTKAGMRRLGAGKLLAVVDWRFRVSATTRRGGAWPRRRRGSAQPEILPLQVVTSNK